MSNRATTDTQTTARAETQPAPEPQTAERTTETRTTETPATTARVERRAAPRSDLPNTAGFLPLLAVIGIGSLVGSRLLRRSRRT